MEIKNLENLSKKLRQLIFQVGLKNDGHISTSLSCVEILISLFYGSYLNFNKKSFNKKNRNTFVLSKGHAETAMYCVLFLKKFISKKYFMILIIVEITIWEVTSIMRSQVSSLQLVPWGTDLVLVQEWH